MGTGRLSTAVAHSLAVVHRPVQEGALKIVCLGRDLSKARWLVTSAAARAAAFDGRIEVHAGLVRWEDPDFRGPAWIAPGSHCTFRLAAVAVELNRARRLVELCA
jgi:hypothetical protein